MATKITYAYIDHSNERSSWSIEGVDLSSANYDAQKTLWEQLRTAAAALLSGTLNKTTISTIDDGSSAVPADSAAQRELKLRVTYADNVNGRKFHTAMPCPDLSHVLNVASTDIWDHTSGDGAAFATAFEAYVRAPGTGNAVTVTQLKTVGRRV